MKWLLLLLFLIIILIVYVIMKNLFKPPVTTTSFVRENVVPSLDKEIVMRKLKALLDSYLKFGPYQGIAYEELLIPKLEKVADCILNRVGSFNNDSQLNTELCFQQGLEWSCGFQEVLDQANALSVYLQRYGMNMSLPDPMCSQVTVTALN